MQEGEGGMWHVLRGRALKHFTEPTRRITNELRGGSVLNLPEGGGGRWRVGGVRGLMRPLVTFAGVIGKRF